jgi:hypothetical protein
MTSAFCREGATLNGNLVVTTKDCTAFRRGNGIRWCVFHGSCQYREEKNGNGKAKD